LLLAGARFLCAGAVLYALLRVASIPAPNAAAWGRSLLGGVLLLSFGNGFVSVAEEKIPSNLAALLVASVPLHIAVLEWLRPGGERPTLQATAGIVLGSGGLVLLAAPDGRSHADPVSVAAVLFAAFSWALGTLYVRYRPAHTHTAMGAALQMICAGLVLLVGSALRGELDTANLSRLSREGTFAFVYLTLFGSLLAFSVYNWLVKVSTPSLLSTVAYVNPVVAVILGWLVLDEKLTPRALFGATLVVGAVAVMSTRRKLPRRACAGDPE
jgi:drug/metabolite transporter (DMT)-like permease